MNLRLNIAVICVLLVSLVPGGAQVAPAGSSVTVEHSVPFGVIPGKLLLLGNYLVFLDEQQPNASFVVPKSAIQNLSADGSAITVQTTEMIRNSSGEVNRLSFRVAPGADAVVVTRWYGSGMAAAAPGSAVRSSTPAAEPLVYQARHKHTFGECSGRFIIAPDRISYESVTDVSHSRRWEYQAIKETKLSNPYELEIEPFSGGDYELRFDGSGMDPAAYKDLVDRIAAARASR